MKKIDGDLSVKNDEKRQFCTFWLMERLYGVDIIDVKEIHPRVDFTPIYHSPKGVSGYVNIRGQVYLILDLRPLMGFEEGTPDEENRLVLFKPTVGEPFGVLVDRIGDVVEVSADELEGSEDMEDSMADPGVDKAGIITGVCQLDDTLLVALNSRNILNSVVVGSLETAK